MPGCCFCMLIWLGAIYARLISLGHVLALCNGLACLMACKTTEIGCTRLRGRSHPLPRGPSGKEEKQNDGKQAGCMLVHGPDPKTPTVLPRTQANAYIFHKSFKSTIHPSRFERSNNTARGNQWPTCKPAILYCTFLPFVGVSLVRFNQLADTISMMSRTV